jgi:hypothetical protein
VRADSRGPCPLVAGSVELRLARGNAFSRALRATCLVLAVLVGLFAATWLSLPRQGLPVDAGSISFPASLFAKGLDEAETRTVPNASDPDCFGAKAGDLGFPASCSTHEVPTGRDVLLPDDLKQRVIVIFGAAALVVVLLGVALGAAKRPSSP